MCDQCPGKVWVTIKHFNQTIFERGTRNEAGQVAGQDWTGYSNDWIDFQERKAAELLSVGQWRSRTAGHLRYGDWSDVLYCSLLLCTALYGTPLYRTVQLYDTIICLQLNDYTTLKHTTAYHSTAYHSTQKKGCLSLSLTHLQDAIRDDMTWHDVTRYEWWAHTLYSTVVWTGSLPLPSLSVLSHRGLVV